MIAIFTCAQKLFGDDRGRGSDAAASFWLEVPYSPNRRPLQYHPVGAINFRCGRRRGTWASLSIVAKLCDNRQVIVPRGEALA